MNALILVNPVAGVMRGRAALFSIVQSLSGVGFDVSVYLTRSKGDAAEYAASRGADFSRVVCCGGDGTLSEVISGLMKLDASRRPELSYIPCGSSNDFARTVGIPANIDKACACAASGTPFSFDVGDMNDKIFTYIASFGAFTKASYATSQKAKNALGHAAYVFEGIGELPSIRPIYLKITCDGIIFEGYYYFGAVSNTLSIAKLYKLPKKSVDLSDGKFEVLLVRRPDEAIDNLGLISNLAVGSLKDRNILLLHASNITIVSPDRPLDFTLDGEFGGSYNRVDIKNLQKAMSVIK